MAHPTANPGKTAIRRTGKTAHRAEKAIRAAMKRPRVSAGSERTAHPRRLRALLRLRRRPGRGPKPPSIRRRSPFRPPPRAPSHPRPRSRPSKPPKSPRNGRTPPTAPPLRRRTIPRSLKAPRPPRALAPAPRPAKAGRSPCRGCPASGRWSRTSPSSWPDTSPQTATRRAPYPTRLARAVRTAPAPPIETAIPAPTARPRPPEGAGRAPAPVSP